LCFWLGVDPEKRRTTNPTGGGVTSMVRPTKAAKLTVVPTAAPASPTAGAEKNGMKMVFVPAGEFLMGAGTNDPNADSSELPQHKVFLDNYWIDKTEVTNGCILFACKQGLQFAAWHKFIYFIYFFLIIIFFFFLFLFSIFLVPYSFFFLSFFLFFSLYLDLFPFYFIFFYLFFFFFFNFYFSYILLLYFFFIFFFFFSFSFYSLSSSPLIFLIPYFFFYFFFLLLL